MSKFVRIFLFLLVVTIFCTSCKKRQVSSSSKMGQENAEVYDLPEIEDGGELIAVTISGPESYYQYHDIDMGLQYLLAEKFANSQGLRIRMEIARDTIELNKILSESKADLIAYELPLSIIKKQGFTACGVRDDKKKTSWAVRKSSPELAQELNKWYRPGIKVEETKEIRHLTSIPLVKRHALAQFFSKSKGIISPYDGLFVRYSQVVGWDWRLMAAQCWQESGFDPKAISWAGARGLMQIMPSTAAEMGVSASSLNEPEINVAASAHCLRQLSAKFSDVRNPLERIKFVLAAYNGGFYHVRDAMKLAAKYHRNPQSWDDVSFFIYRLSDPRYYRDPMVKYGYMIGNETYNYVNQIMFRWRQYCGSVHGSPASVMNLNTDAIRSHKKNRFSKPGNILSRKDSIFQISQ